MRIWYIIEYLIRPFGKWNWNVANLPPTKVAGTFDYILSINMIHITPWSCTEGLFKNASGLLKPNGFMITYGPFASNGEKENTSMHILNFANY